MLSTFRSLRVTPDFLIEHNYPEWTDQESDPFLLQYSAMWPGEAASLRQQISDKLTASDDRCFAGLDAYQKVIDSGINMVILATPPGFRPGGGSPRGGGGQERRF